MKPYWCSSELRPGSERVAFGVDFRSPSIWTELAFFDGKFRPTDNASYVRSPTTIADSIWPSCVPNTKSVPRNGLTDLFEVADFDCVEGVALKDALPVAFDIAASAIPHLSANGWIEPKALSVLPERYFWELQGFDVIDDWLQLSALYGFTWDSDIAKVVDDPRVEFSSSGILASEESALVACSLFDALASEHAPFLPCGVWIGRLRA